LSLAQHINNTVILREQYTFNAETLATRTQSGVFEIVFISILREYMELEYKECLKEAFNLEKVINDFILVSIFMGNDFVPHLYCMNVRSGNFDDCIKKLKEYYTDKKNYLVEKWKINWTNFNQYFSTLIPL